MIHPTPLAVLSFLASWQDDERPTLRTIREGADADLHDSGHVAATLRRLDGLGLVELVTRRPTDAGRALLATATEPAKVIPA